MSAGELLGAMGFGCGFLPEIYVPETWSWCNIVEIVEPLRSGANWEVIRSLRKKMLFIQEFVLAPKGSPTRVSCYK